MKLSAAISSRPPLSISKETKERSLLVTGLVPANDIAIGHANFCGQFGPVAQRITRLTTDQKIAGSNPAWIEIFLSFNKYLL